MKKIVFILFLFCYFIGHSQGFKVHKSIHQLQSEEYAKYDFSDDTEWDRFNNFKKSNFVQPERHRLNKIVFGWHPYWSGSSYLNYQWAYLTDLAYFSYTVNYADGEAISLHGWETSPVVDTALAHGVRVHLTATLFGHHTEFFASEVAQQTLIDNLISQVKARNAVGINIDFEGMKSSHTEDFTEFMKKLSEQFKAEVPDGIVSICLYAVDWHKVFEINKLEPYVDLYTIMGYDYYYSGSSQAGPTGQLYTFSTFNYTQSRTISFYLHRGASPNKLILGVPYFGFEWQTENLDVPSQTVKYIKSRTVGYVKKNESGNYSSSHVEPNSLGNYFTFAKDGKYYQTWVEDENTLKYSYKLVNQIGIGGVAIWALSYDNGYDKMWHLLRDYFSECAEPPLTDTIWDLGGPKKPYFNYEKFTYTIKPTKGNALSLKFLDFELENEYDSLYIYDGENTLYPLVGGYSGTNKPADIIATNNALTLRFFSDKATTKQGWTAVWNTIEDKIKPTTSINTSDWVSNIFKANFIDSDNLKVKHKFYQVIDYSGTEWRANSDYGFAYDDFDENIINSEWTQVSGSWVSSAGRLKQIDNELSNTNIYLDVNQQSKNIYMYSWDMVLSGDANNRRGGLHFFCDDASQNNRHNNYMVYFRADQNQVHIYKYYNNNFTLELSEECNIEANVMYNYKIMYNPQTGKISAFQNDNLVAEWIDSQPYTFGNSVSLRVGNSVAEFDNFRIFKSRAEAVEITVGDENSELRYESSNTNDVVGTLSSLVIDYNNNFSLVVQKEIKVDLSSPSEVTMLHDGIGDDLDTTDAISQLSANWQASVDANSAIKCYHYAVGTSPMNDDVYSWKSGELSLNITLVGLSLEYNKKYYFSVRAENLAGLLSEPISSDGIFIVMNEEPPVADFSVNSETICSNDSVFYYYTGINANSFLWQFNNANISTSNEMNLWVKYNDNGNYGAKLIVSNDFGSDTITKSSVVRVNKSPEVDFVGTPLTGSVPIKVNFTNLSASDAVSYLWDFGDNTIKQTDFFESELSHIYTLAGNLSVSLFVDNGLCASNILKNNYFNFEYSLDVNEENNDFIVYPNPTKDILFIENLTKDNYSIEIINTSGEIIIRDFNKTNLEISGLLPGVYFLRIVSGNNVLLKKIIKI